MGSIVVVDEKKFEALPTKKPFLYLASKISSSFDLSNFWKETQNF